jgi:hypothetical protein
MDMNYVWFKSANCGPECPGVSQYLKLADQPVSAGYSQRRDHLSTGDRNFFVAKYKYLVAFLHKVLGPFSGVYASSLCDEA